MGWSRTLCSFLQSVFADLDIVFFDTRIVLLRLRKRAQPYSERMTFDALSFLLCIDRSSRAS